MAVNWFYDLLQQHRELLVFSNVLAQQLGLPVPAVPTLMLNGSRSDSLAGLLALLLCAVLASLLADLIWYQAGKRFGYRVLTFLCKMSINPGSCVNQTELRFQRWGVWSLVVGKFIPGFSTVAPPVAGALGMSRLPFMFASGVGAGLWAGLALLAGYGLQNQIDLLLVWLAANGIRVASIFALMLACWIGWKFWQKRRFEHQAAIPHISIGQLLQQLNSNDPPHIIDLRSSALIAETGPIAGAHVSNTDSLLQTVSKWPTDTSIVTLCACPADAGAIHAAQILIGLGYQSVRPLAGGFEAWQAAHRSSQSATPEHAPG